MTTERKLPGNIDCFLQCSPQLFKQYYTTSKICKQRYREMKILPVQYQNLNKLELCAFDNTLCLRLMSHKHFSICSSLQNSSSDLTGLQGKFKFKDILIYRLKTYGMIFSYLCIRLYCHLRSCTVSLLASSCCSRMVQVYPMSHVIYQPRCL